ncbi:MAG: hypothetical protein ACRDQ2_16975, partial [Gaiellales bacterium]
MKVRGRGGTVSGVAVGFVVCVAGLAWAMHAGGSGRRADEAADLAGVWGLPIGLVGAVLAAWSSWAALHALRDQRTGEVVADDLARFVVRDEGAQYRQLLGSGPAAPDGRLDLSFAAVATGARNTAPDGTLEGIVEYYRNLRPGRLIITGCMAPGPDGATDGDAGTGKTVLALALLLGLAKERVSGEPVPVRLVAASWPGSEIRGWLEAHLSATYRLSARDAALLVDSNLVLPVIDGLDEMDSCTSPGYTSRAATLLRAVERFEDGGTHCPVVITCRHGHYQTLVDADVQPNIAAHIALNRVDASRAGDYFRQRVAVTEGGRARWQPVLSALDLAAEPGAENAAASAATLAGMLDTPWRLTLAITVFEERAADGRYLRDPADLLTFATEGRLYSYLLEHYIGAAVAAPRHDVGNAVGDSNSETRTRLEATAAGQYLATLAGYLNANAGIDGGPPRTIRGRVLSSSDLVLHELWPLAGSRGVQWVERVLVALLTLALPSMLRIFFRAPDDMLILRPFLILLLASVLLAVIYRPTWPETRQIDFRRLRTRRGRRAAIIGFLLCYLLCMLVLYALGQDWEQIFDFGVPAGLVVGLTFGLVAGEESPGSGPGDPVRRDLATALVPALVLLIVISAVLGSLLVSTYLFGYVGITPGNWILLWFLYLCSFAVVCGLFVFGLPIGGGVGALRYVTFLLCTRGRLPWRLGRFLQAC